MDFKKKLKIRVCFAISYCVLGFIMIVIAMSNKLKNDIWGSMGMGLFAIGLVKIRNYFIITRSEDSIERQRIAENDERNISIVQKAISAAFYIYVIIAAIAIIILELLNKELPAMIIGGTVCAMLIIYTISYFIIRKKS